ncbi:hypothetical protein RUM43_002366 [Polyplax serrata]|uniref:Uncharacterized protein n=1 Tax=Polyplax serrata TaxID=468196 RepID=A0AAN8S970_POLSC
MAATLTLLQGVEEADRPTLTEIDNGSRTEESVHTFSNGDTRQGEPGMLLRLICETGGSRGAKLTTNSPVRVTQRRGGAEDSTEGHRGRQPKRTAGRTT